MRETSHPCDQVLTQDIDMKANAWYSISAFASSSPNSTTGIAPISFFLTVNNIHTLVAIYRILSCVIDRCCKHAKRALEAVVMQMPVMLMPDLLPSTSQVVLLVVSVLMPLREHEW